MGGCRHLSHELWLAPVPVDKALLRVRGGGVADFGAVVGGDDSRCLGLLLRLVLGRVLLNQSLVGDHTCVLGGSCHTCIVIIVQVMVSRQTDTLSLDEGASERCLLRLVSEASRRPIAATDRGLVQSRTFLE